MDFRRSMASARQRPSSTSAAGDKPPAAALAAELSAIQARQGEVLEALRRRNVLEGELAKSVEAVFAQVRGLAHTSEGHRTGTLTRAR